MQQTAKYQFNLVDSSDDFSPAPLNQNMEKVEEELDSLTSALTQGLGGLEDSLDAGLASLTAALGSGGHTCRIAHGSYNGTGQFGESHKNSLSFDFTPVAVLIGTAASTQDNAFPGLFLRGMSTGHSCYGYPTELDPQLHLTWQAQGVIWYSNSEQYHQMNVSGYTYYYVALGYSQA